MAGQSLKRTKTVLPWRGAVGGLGALSPWPPPPVAVVGDVPPHSQTLPLNSLKTTEFYH